MKQREKSCRITQTLTNCFKKKNNEALKKLLKELETKNQQLRESESKYRILTENISDSIWIMDLNTLKAEYVSPSVMKNRGYTQEEAKAQTLEQTLSPQSYETAIRILSEELEKEKDPAADPKRSRTMEIQETVKGGGYTWSETTVSFLRDQAGVPNKIMGVTRYIDERKKTEKQIAENEKKYRNLFENGSDLICIHDLEGIILDTNLQYKEEYGWKHEDIVGLNIRDLIPEKYQPDFDEYLARILKNTEDKGYLKGRTLSGQKVILEYRNQLIFDENNQPVAVQGSGRDVTEQFMAQKALRESEEKYKSLVRHAPAGIYEYDMQNLKFISVNDVMCEYSGYTEAEFLTLNPSDVLDEDSKESFEALVATVFSSQPRELATEYKVKKKNNEEMWVLSNTRFFYEDGIPKRAMSVIHDLTDIRKAEEERRNLEIQLQQAHKMEAIGTLAGGIAHDFNNILAGILGYCDLLKQNINTPEKAQAQIGHIKQGARRAAELVKQILTFSRKEEYEKSSQALSPIIMEAMKLLRPSIPVTIDIQENINSQARVLADPAKIHQVIMNLCTNAYHAMNKTGGILSVDLTDTWISESQADHLQILSGKYARLEVTDTGHGMDPKTLDRIFEPYFTTKKIGKGTGMGLSLVYAIIREHNGVIKASSIKGKGSTFTVYLPETEETSAGGKIEKIDILSARGNERIMIVDDEQSILESTRELLSDYGYAVDCFPDGKLALEAFKNDPMRFDLVLTDMTMPRMTGEVLARNIFNIRRDLPIILCSGYNEEISETRALEMGISRFITKPVIDQPLPDIIREVLNAKITSKN
ncbi:MAG: PAS domain S-box protein [Proteobacteria bacterium]|nr:PAS domain S-box protein [Pseudomonadota bacterium]MBU1388696.1 PAS domain S-box protein [Pseudomonadota bacterium]MBU1541906.1 PAS domain S-box protein [Pseudomonadota bacterium]MBU2480868.1 PAS domain S-box protein [Pseudomonadota bacterium]